jgi:hypothetical protein
MEPEVKKFLAIIIQAMSMVILWLLILTLFGIKFGLLFFDQGATAWHFVFYGWLLLSFPALCYYLWRKWKEMPKFETDHH